MSSIQTCQRCGAELRSKRAAGLCPRCLMAMNFDSQTMPEGEDFTPVPPLSAEELAQHFSQFEILECLGRGGMGVVYKARQKTLDRLVALKVLAGEWQGDDGFAERFEKEAKTLAQMSHPNIVTIHDFGETGGQYYIVMEYIDGVNLRDLLDQEGRVKIADFGIASLVGVSSERSGTPPYMAPEQEGEQVDRRADVYALGVVLYEMLTGERPTKDLVSPSQKVEIDVRIDEMVLRALEKEPQRRYQTAGEFRTVAQTLAEPQTGEALEKYQHDRDVNLGSGTAPKRLSLFSKIFAALPFFFGILSGLVLVLSYGFRLWAAPWLADAAIKDLLKGALLAAVLAMLLGLFTKKNRWGKQGLIMGSFSLVVWLCFAFAGKLPQASGGGMRISSSKDVFGRTYEVRGGSKAMCDSDGDASIYRIDSDVLRFDKDSLQFNGYHAGELEPGIEKILIEKKDNRIEVYTDGELAFRTSKHKVGKEVFLVAVKSERKFLLHLADSNGVGGKGPCFGQVHLTLEGGWLVVRRWTAEEELEWAVILAQANSVDEAEVELESGGVNIEVRLGEFFLKDSLAQLRVLREVKTEEVPAWPKFDLPASEKSYGWGGGGLRKMTGWRVGEWLWVASGPEEAPDVFLRLEHEKLLGDGFGFSPQVGLTRALADPSEATEDGELFTARRRLPYFAKAQLKQRNIRETLIGKSAPEIDSVPDQLFNSQDSLNEAMKGKVVLLDFWGTWCGPCVAKLPVTQAMYEKYRERGLVVVGIHSKQNADELAGFLQSKDFTFPIAVDTGKTAEAFGVEVWPTYFLVSRKGEVVWGFENKLPSEGLVEELLSQPIMDVAEQNNSQPLRFVPQEGFKSSWTVLPKGSALHPEGWAVMANLAMGGEARPKRPEQEDAFLLLRLLDGNDDWIKLEVKDLAQDQRMTISLKRGEPASILADGRGYRVLFPWQDVAKDSEAITPYATVLITEKNEDKVIGFAEILRDLFGKKRNGALTENQQAVENRLLTLLGAEMKEMIEQQLLSHGGNQQAKQQMRDQFEKEMRTHLEEMWDSIESVFTPTEEEAVLLLENGPDKEGNQILIQERFKALEELEVSLPFILVYLHQKYSRMDDHDPWFLELLQRATKVLVKEVK